MIYLYNHFLTKFIGYMIIVTVKKQSSSKYSTSVILSNIICPPTLILGIFSPRCVLFHSSINSAYWPQR